MSRKPKQVHYERVNQPAVEVEIKSFRRSTMQRYGDRTVEVYYTIENTGKHNIDRFRVALELELDNGTIQTDTIRESNITIPPGISVNGQHLVRNVLRNVKDVRIAGVELN